MRPDEVLDTLQRAGFEAWYVGGCVRDTLLGRPIHDWDVTTSALPEQVLALFPRTVPTGLQHGTVTVLSDSGPVEVTTYRADGDYHDGRHPDGVRFVRSLREDTARRDFTVNAMAMDQRGNIRDFYGGRADLAAGILRCVGAPERRFREDALRMLRACRFAAQLGFTIEPETWAALLRCAPLCKQLSRERITEEVTKTIRSPSPQWAAAMIRCGLLTSCCLTGSNDLSWLSMLPPTADSACLFQNWIFLPSACLPNSSSSAGWRAPTGPRRRNASAGSGCSPPRARKRHGCLLRWRRGTQ